MKKTLLLLTCLLSAGCITKKATQFAVPKERATECVAHCNDLDMKLSAVVIISSSAGCVCEPRDAQASTGNGAAAVVGGAMIAEEEARQQEQQERQRRHQSPSIPRSQ
ncbi:hypothetical protein JQX13_14670 [Archangium violaceum]|uniref:hypothetical protein n=1 Tax=Archangium violaceum TaxID=83451 RepID=UPI00193C5DE5|nr:hypothetical protein [Archangium violaceum]QRK11202.1 hypothetical protein JQX13_14670 [Archangium violaceum]